MALAFCEVVSVDKVRASLPGRSDFITQLGSWS
jgi:hypothetical protein